MLLLIILLFLGNARQYSIQLKSKYNQEHLIQLVNMLQHSHAQILEFQHYERIEQDVQGLLQFETVLLEKKKIIQNEKSQKHQKKKMKHQKREHKYIVINEALMDVIPLTNDEKDAFQNSDNLIPIDFGLEQQMEHRNQKLVQGQRVLNGAYIADVPLKNMANTMFIGELQVGSAKGKNRFDVIFDTGSALTCITSVQCKDIGCQKSKRYNRAESKSFNEIGKQVEIVFGSGTLKGLINKEQINVDGLNLKDALFIEVTQQIGDAFHEGEFDGIVGLGYPHMTGVPTLFDYMMKQHKLHQNIFTFHLNRKSGNSGSRLIFGGSDDSQIKGQWVYHKVHEQFYWSIMAEEIRVGNRNTGICSQQHKCKMVIDTGTTLLTGPTKDVRTLLSMIKVEPRCQNFLTMPDITFVIDGKNYILKPKEYVLTFTQAGVESPYQHSSIDQIVGCAGTIFPLDLPPKQGPLWILGDIFITKYSAKFDRHNNRVGLALNKNV